MRIVEAFESESEYLLKVAQLHFDVYNKDLDLENIDEWFFIDLLYNSYNRILTERSSKVSGVQSPKLILEV